HDSWGLVRFNTDTIDPGSFGKGAPYLEFQAAEGLVMGNAGCNSLTGGFTPGYRSIRFGDLAATEMWCMGDGVMDFEARFLKTLSGDRFDLSFANAELTLRHADGTELVFRRMD
ncbi:MAG: META domain-containing protein, partial [Flavobacteriales bacterium]|nr:META domain-containing protein [Flavobacteriales bacterium]